MLLLDRLKLHKVVLFKDAELDLNYRGLTVVRGHNKNAIGARHKTNAAGKSLLTSTLPNTFFSSHPVLSKLGKRTSGMKGGLLKEKDSFVELSMRRSEGELVVPYTIIKHAHRSGVGYKVLRDGKDMELRTASIAEEFISEFLPFTEEEFYTHTYLDSRRPHLLTLGSPTERAKFLSDLFRMDSYDFVKDRCNALRRDLSDEAIRLDELKKRSSEIKKELSDLDEDELRSRLIEREAALKKLKKKADKAYSAQSELNVYLANERTIGRVKKVADSLKERDLRKLLTSLKTQSSELEHQIEQITRYKLYRVSRASFMERSEKLRTLIGKDKRSIKELRSAIDKVETARDGLEHGLKEGRKGHARTKEELDGALKNGVDKKAERKAESLDSKEELERKLDREEAKLNASQRILKMMDGVKQGKDCLLCGSSVKHSHKDGIKDRLQEQVKDYRKQVSKYEQQIDTVKAAEKSKAARAEVERLTKELAKWDTEIGKLERKLKKLPDTDAEQKVLDAKLKLKNLDEPKWDGAKPEGNKVRLKKKQRRLLKTEALIKSFMPLAEKLSSIEAKYAGQDIHALAKTQDRRYKKVQSKLQKVVAEVSRIDPMLKMAVKLKKELRDIEAEQATKNDSLRDVPVLEMLSNLYSGKGLKNRKMREYAMYIQDSMNRYADSIYHEKFRFEFNIEPNRFDIYAHAGTGKKQTTREVRSLSGAESKAFAMLVLSSLLFLLPSRNRTNCLILDEMDSGLDEEGRSMFIDSFLPELNKIVPHILVVTPLNDEYPGSRVVTAVKEGNESCLVYRQAHEH